MPVGSRANEKQDSERATGLLSAMRKRLSPGARKIIGNTSWLLGERALRLVVAVLVNAWVARYLGPSRFGLLNYAMAFVAIFGPITTLGLEGIVVRDIVRRTTSSAETLGTTFALRLIGGGLCFGAVYAAISLANPHQPLTRALVAIVATGMLFRAFDTIDFWNQSQVQSKYTVYATSTGMLLAGAIKVALIITKAPLAAFAWATASETFIAAVGLVIVYHHNGQSMASWRVTAERAKSLLHQSWPLILSGFGALVNLDIDRVMLGKMAGPTEVGIYSAAARLSEIWYFTATAVVTSAFPALVHSRTLDKKVYNMRLQQLYDHLVWMALSVAVAGTLLSRPVVHALYGSAYERAAPILALHIWASLFTFQGALLSKWLINEGLLKFSFIRHGFGAVVNVLMNLYMIPRYGAVGAAISTLVSYATSHWIACFTYPKTRVAGRMMAFALLIPIRTVLRLTHHKEVGE